MFNICEEEHETLNMLNNPIKSACPGTHPSCEQAFLCIISNISNEGMPIPWCNTCRYLEVYLTCPKNFIANFDQGKSYFNGTCSGIMGKIGLSALHDVMVQLLRFKYVSILCYKCLQYYYNVVKSLDYVITCAFFKYSHATTPASLPTANRLLASINCLTLLLLAERDSSVDSLNHPAGQDISVIFHCNVTSALD